MLGSIAGDVIGSAKRSAEATHDHDAAIATGMRFRDRYPWTPAA